MIYRSPHKYEPLVLNVVTNQYGYRVVTLSLWPGGRLSVTLAEQGLTVDQAEEAALSMVPNIMKLIGE